LRSIAISNRNSDGSGQTLRDVIDHYNKGDGIADPWLDNDMQSLALTESDKPFYSHPVV